MPSTHITIATANANKYLKQLCKHFGHKVDVEFDDENGFAALPPGPCTMRATAQELYIHCQAHDPEKLPMSQSIIETHLVKFAWREEIVFDWQDCPDVKNEEGA